MLFVLRNILFHLFIWLRWVLVVARRIFRWACELLSSFGARTVERAGSVVVARWLSCSAACGILVPQPGIEPASPALEGRFLTTGHQGNPQEYSVS